MFFIIHIQSKRDIRFHPVLKRIGCVSNSMHIEYSSYTYCHLPVAVIISESLKCLISLTDTSENLNCRPFFQKIAVSVLLKCIH